MIGSTDCNESSGIIRGKKFTDHLQGSIWKETMFLRKVSDNQEDYIWYINSQGNRQRIGSSLPYLILKHSCAR
jgi:hypothetical protein